MSEINDTKQQNVFLRHRSEIQITGVQAVDSFDEFRICATCLDGTTVIIDGTQLSVKEVNLEKGILEAVGNISGFFYDDNAHESKSGFFKNRFLKR